MSQYDVERLHRTLAKSQISIITSRTDAEVARLQAKIDEPLHGDTRGQIEDILGQLAHAGAAPTPKTLDLIGHATSDGLFRIGSWVLDGTSPKVTAFFRGLAESEILPR